MSYMTAREWFVAAIGCAIVLAWIIGAMIFIHGIGN